MKPSDLILRVSFVLVMFFFSAFCNFKASGQVPMTTKPVQQAADVIIHTGTSNSDLIFRVNGRDGRLYQVYLGEKLSDPASLSQSREPGHVAYATFGTDNLFEPAIRITHSDGNPSLELKYKNHEVIRENENITLTKIRLADPEYPVEVTLYIKTYNNENIFEQWTEIIHREKKPVTLYNYASSMLHFDAGRYWLTHFHGDWAEEMKMAECELTAGIKILDSKLGSRAHMYQTPGFILSLNEKPEEKHR